MVISRALRCAAIVGLCAGLPAAAPGCKSSSQNADAKPRTARRPSHPTPAMLSHSDPTDEEAPVPELKVNGEILAAADVLKPYAGELLDQSRKLTPDSYRRYVHDKTLQATQQKVSEMLLYQVASARLTEDDEKGLEKVLDAEIRRRVSELGGGVQWEYEKLLRRQGLTLDEERARLRRQIVIQRYLHLHIYPKIQSPARNELLALFEEHRAELAQPERRRMSLIEINVLKRLPQDVTAPTREQQAEARDAALRQMHEAVAQIHSGRPFAEVAAEFSEGLHAENGGDWGWVGRHALRDPWQKAVEALYALPEGAVSGVIETPETLFLVRCDQIQPAVEPDFISLQPELIERYREEHSDEMINTLLKDLHARARVEPERIDRFLSAVAETAPPYPTTSDKR